MASFLQIALNNKHEFTTTVCGIARFCFGLGIRLTAFIYIFSTPAIAQTNIQFVAMHLEPYGMLDEEGKPVGMLKDMYAEIMAVSGLKGQVSVVPIKRMGKQMQQKTSHCVIQLRTRQASEDYLEVAEIYQEFNSLFIGRAGVRIASVSDLHGLRLARPRGSYTGFPYTKDTKIVHHLTNNYQASVRLLKSGRVDAIAGTELSLHFNMRRLGLKRSELGDFHVFDKTPLYLYCAKEVLSDAIVKKLAKSIQSLRQRQVLDNIVRKYKFAEYSVKASR